MGLVSGHVDDSCGDLGHEVRGHGVLGILIMSNRGGVAAVSGSVPASSNDPVFDKALSYMGFSAGQKLAGSPINVVFVRSVF